MAAWIFFGMAWLALLINHCIDLLEHFNGYMKERQESLAASSQSSPQEETEGPEKKPKWQHKSELKDNTVKIFFRLTILMFESGFDKHSLSLNIAFHFFYRDHFVFYGF